MYIPNQNAFSDQGELFEFMKRFSFATQVSSNDNFPTATHLPFLVERSGYKIKLLSDEAGTTSALEDTIDRYDRDYQIPWQRLPSDFKSKFFQGNRCL